MFTDQELDILEFEIFPIVNKFNDLQKVFENLDEDQVLLFSKGCEIENIDTAEITVGTFGREENDVLYLCGFPKNGYKKYKGDGYRPWFKKIKEVKTETSIILPENCRDMFDGCDKLESIDVSNGNVSNVKNMNGMFNRCNSLTALDVSNGDVSKVKNMGSMFAGCKSLANLNVSNGNVSKVENMGGMFYNCEKLENLDVSNGDVSSVINMTYMFADCKSLENLDVSNGDVSKVENMCRMFDGCISLIELKGILNGDLHFSLDTDKMFNDTPLLKDRDKIINKFRKAYGG